MTIGGMIGTALQIAISYYKNGKTENEAIIECRNRNWRQYTPEIQAAVDRSIHSYFVSQKKNVSLAVETIESVE